jgi:hypothetical protein
MTSQIKITQLSDIGNNIANTTLVPVVNMSGVSTTQKATMGNIANSILAGAGTAYQNAGLANLAFSVANAAQPNITSLGTLSVNTLKISGGSADQILSTDGTGNLSWVAQSGGGANTGNVTFNDVNIIGDGNLYLQPNPSNTDAYLDVYLTSGPDIHIAGNNENLILGRDEGANIVVGVDGNVAIQANAVFGGNSHTWMFDYNGNTTLPDNTVLQNGGGIEFPATEGEWDLHSSDEKIYIGALPSSMAYIDTYDANISVRIRTLGDPQEGPGYDWIFDPTGNLTLPGNTFSVNYANGQQVQLGGGGNANIGNFIFDTLDLDGTTFDEITLTGTNSGNIIVSAPGLAMVIGGYESGGMVTDGSNTYLFNGDPSFVNGIPQSGVGNIWQFDNTGNLILPGNTFSINYANGAQAQLGGYIANFIFPNPTSNTSTIGVNDGSDIVINPTYGGSSPAYINVPGSINGPTTEALQIYNGYSLGYGSVAAVSIGASAIDGITIFGDGSVATSNTLTVPASDNGSIVFSSDGTTNNGSLKVDAGLNMTINANSNFYVKQNGSDRLGITNTNTDLMAASNVVIHANKAGSEKNWIFDTTGNLRTPGNVDIYGAINFPQQVSSINWSTYNIELSQYGRINTNVDFFANANVIGAQYLKGDGSNITNVNAIQVINGTSNIRVSTTNGNVVITTNTDNQWMFDYDGNLTLPQLTTINDVSGNGTTLTVGVPPTIIVISGADFSAVNNTYTRDFGQATPTWYPAGYTPGVDSYIMFTGGQYGIYNPGFVPPLYVNTGTLNRPLTQWSLNPPLGSVPPTAVYTYGFPGPSWKFDPTGLLTIPGDINMRGANINWVGQFGNINWGPNANTYGMNFSQYGYVILDTDLYSNANVIGAQYLKGDGSNISNINASNITNAYSNSNVISLLGDLGGNGISNVGNIDISGNINFTNNSAVQQSSIVVNQFRTIETVTLSANSQNNATLLTLEDTGNANLRAWQDINLNTYTQTTNNNFNFGANGNLTIPGNISGSGSNGLMISSNGNVILNSKGAEFIFDAPAGNFYLPNPGGAIVFADNSVQNTAYIPTQATGNWELVPGVNSANISVPLNGTYSIWVRGNIPNGIITYTATAVVTNNNVPVLGSSYGWYYAAGNALVLTSMPTQFVGTLNTISNAVVATTTANVFEFSITNNSGANAVVNWGYTKL